MANLKVLQDQPEKLKSQLYGFDGTNVVPLSTDSSGRTDIRLLTSADTVTAVATNLDIRDLGNATDSVTVYGNDGSQNRALKTTATGQLDIRPLTNSDTVTVTATDLNIRPLTSSDTVTVTATGLDIRPLTNADTVTVTATDLNIRPLTSSDTVTVTATGLDIRPLTNADTVTVTATDLNIRPLTSSDTVTVTATSLDIRPLTSADTVTVTATDLNIRKLTNADTVTAVINIDHTEDDLGDFATGNTYAGTTGQDVSIWRTFTFFVENTSTEARSATFKVQISPDNAKWVDDSAEIALTQGQYNIASASHYLRYARIAYKSTTTDQAANINVTFQAQA